VAHRTTVLNVLLGLALTLLVSAPAAAQGHVFGTVKDPDDHPIKGATITAENPNAAPSYATSISDSKGRFAFLGLRGGLWTFTIQAPGFEGVRTVFTTRTLGVNPALDVVLKPAPEPIPAGPIASLDVAALRRRLDEAAGLESAGRLDQAIKSYREIAADLPVLTTIHLQLGLLFERTHDTDSAAAEYRIVLKSEPDNAKALAGLDRLAGK
jgi:tetratricopeptide (TPR) repeat protein